jgi:hypothetical protein
LVAKEQKAIMIQHPVGEVVDCTEADGKYDVEVHMQNVVDESAPVIQGQFVVQ